MTALVGVIMTVVMLVGCSPSSPYSAATAAAFESRVLAVSTSAAASDFETALTQLDDLEAALNDALAAGEITQERFDRIQSASALVRADLEAELAAVVVPDAPGNSDDKPDKPGKPDKNGDKGDGKGD